MQAWDAIRARRNVRRYQERPVPMEVLDRIVEAGRRTPSSRNQQRWDFIVCTERGQLQELSKVWRGGRHVATSAATVALIAPRTDDLATRASIDYDLGQVTMSMMIAAADLEVGSGHSAVADQQLAHQILGHPDDRRCAYLIAFGYPAGRPLKPLRALDRRQFDEVVHWDRW